MGRLNYSARRIDGVKAGQVLSKDLRKRIPPGAASRAALRDPYLEIDIAAKDLTDEGFDQFIDDLIECLEFRDADHPQGIAKLHELHLQQNALTTRSLEKLARVVSLSERDLRELDLSDNNFEVHTIEQRKTWQEFLESFRGCFMLKKLDFSRNALGPRGLEILVRVYVKSDLDFFEPDSVIADELPRVESNSDLSVLRPEVGKENAKPGIQLPANTPRKSRSVLQSKGRCQTLSPAARVCTEAELKRYSCTRGLRSVPYLIISNVSMTSGSAVHLSTILSMHRAPERLLAFLPGGKALTLPDLVGCSKGIVWLPNENLGSLAREFLTMTEKLGQSGSDTESEGDLNDNTGPLVVHGHSNGDVKRRQMRKKLDVEYTRLKKRVRIDVLNFEGVHSAEIWSVALKMMVQCRAMLLEDKDRPTAAVSGEGFRTIDHEDQANPEAFHTATESGIVTSGPFHPATENFDIHFPTLQGKARSVSQERPRKDTNPMLPSHSKIPNSSFGKGLNHTASMVIHPHPRKEKWRFGLPMDVWRRIIANAVGAEGILDREQQLQIMSYATNWNSLAQEMSVKGAADHQQIWKILDSMGCFTYNPPS
ncbi:hypothetical protein VTN77DRAFT_7594 [Rasamsonia byssochlamydoides]|uniref:uncharacterized protein n=1 Tax=Rasamsonia byssochlamydoides TaxID=89139 RepID=UPI003744ACC9